MSIAKKLKYTLDSVNDIIDALESHGYNMANYVLGDYGNLIRQLSAKVTNGGTTGMKFIPITTKLVPTAYILDTIKAVSVEDYSFMQELNRNYLYSGTDIFKVPTNYALDTIQAVSVENYSFMQELNRNYLYDGINLFDVPTTYTLDTVRVVTTSTHDFMQEMNRNYLYSTDIQTINTQFTPLNQVQVVEAVLIENNE